MALLLLHLLSVCGGPTAHSSASVIHEWILGLASAVDARRAKHARSCRILGIGARHLSLLCGSTICRTLAMNEILTCTFENIARLGRANSTIFALFSELLRPLHLLLAFVGVLSCIYAPLVR